jgi:hypothetical protein
VTNEVQILHFSFTFGALFFLNEKRVGHMQDEPFGLSTKDERLMNEITTMVTKLSKRQS